MAESRKEENDGNVLGISKIIFPRTAFSPRTLLYTRLKLLPTLNARHEWQKHFPKTLRNIDAGEFFFQIVYLQDVLRNAYSATRLH
jgi:hypothetical protein